MLVSIEKAIPFDRFQAMARMKIKFHLFICLNSNTKTMTERVFSIEHARQGTKRVHWRCILEQGQKDHPTLMKFLEFSYQDPTISLSRSEQDCAGKSIGS